LLLVEPVPCPPYEQGWVFMDGFGNQDDDRRGDDALAVEVAVQCGAFDADLFSDVGGREASRHDGTFDFQAKQRGESGAATVVHTVEPSITLDTFCVSDGTPKLAACSFRH